MEERNYNGCPPKTPFQKNVENVINSLRLDDLSNTPDHILAKFIDNVFWAANNLIKDREAWYEHHDEQGKTVMTLMEFINNFSHNNEIWIENREHYCMTYKYRTDDESHDGLIMDWELPFTDIADCRVIKISNVIHPKGKQGITIVIDTDEKEFNFLQDTVNTDNSPAWLYEKVHNVKLNTMCCDD